MSTELAQPDLAATAAAQKEAWIVARCEEFAAQPENRDRALALILYDSMMLQETVGEMMGLVKREGLGGLVKALMGGMKK